MEAPFSIDLAVAVLSGASLLSLAVKLVILIWAYIRTHKLATIVYWVFLLINSLMPLILSTVMTPAELGFKIIFVNAGSALLEVGLFVWLVRSLLKRPSSSLNDA
ncbi:MAG: hypothetical protein AAFN12_02535 [Cyanobacteria bacterium J06560_2]